MSAPVAELNEVVKFYGAHQALGPVTLDVPQGTVGLLGPNGAGKSTLIRILLGLLPPTEGSVRVLGEPMSREAAGLRRRIGYVPEGDARFPGMTGVRSVAYAGRLVGMAPDEAKQRAHQVLDYVDLGEERYRLADGFSTGMRQRLKLAQALVHDPELLILDEPTEGVDPEARDDLLELLDDLQRLHGLNLLISTHILPDVEDRADHAIVLHQGKLVAAGPLEDLKRPTTPGFLVRVNAPSEEFAPALDDAGVPWTHVAPNLRVEVEDPRDVLRIARDAGYTVRHLDPVRLTLTEALEEAVVGSTQGGEA